MKIERSENGMTGKWTNPREMYRFLGAKNKRPKLHLFRYSAVTDHLLDSLGNGYLWYSTPQNLNDPFDSKLFIDYALQSEELRKYLAYVELAKEKNAKHMFFQDKSDEHEYIERLAIPSSDFSNDEKGLNLLNNIAFLSRRSKMLDQEIGVCSFTEDPKSMLMWAHYASSHTGVCLRFKHLSSKGLLWSCYPIKYGRSVWKFKGNPNNDKDIFTIFVKSTFRKSAIWSYEKEWRAVSFEHYGPTGYDLSDLDGIIFGINTSEEDKRNVIAAVQSNDYPNVNFYQAFHDPFRYKIYLIPVDDINKAKQEPF